VPLAHCSTGQYASYLVAATFHSQQSGDAKKLMMYLQCRHEISMRSGESLNNMELNF
jgi:hypothetical protein